MIVDEAAGLQERIEGGGAYETKALGFEVARETGGEAVAGGDMAAIMMRVEDRFAVGVGPQ